MYYEEKCIDGVWYWRDTPDGKWLKFSYLALQGKLNEVLSFPTPARNQAMTPLTAAELERLADCDADQT